MPLRARLLFPALLLALSASPAVGQVDKAEQALRDLEYTAALKALEVARKQPGNDRATTVRILELQAVTLAATGQDAKALKAFQQLLSLSPDFKLTGNHPPRVTTALYEARGWLDANQPLRAEASPARSTAEAITAVQLTVTNDPLKLAREVRFHLEVDGAKSERDVPLTSGGAAAPVSGRRVAWWAELLGEKKAALLSVGTVGEPRIEEVAAPKGPSRRPEPEPKPELKPAPEPVGQVTVPAPRPAADEPLSEWTAPPRPMPAGRVAGLIIAGGGVAAAGVGVAFGVMANATAAQVTSATTDPAGRITSLTQRQALALDAQQRTQATLANVFLVSGAVLAAGGVTLALVSRDAAEVALAPAPGGLSLTGRF